MKIPIITKLNIPSIIHAASRLERSGELAVSHNNLTYLNIDDAYIHKLFPLLQDRQIKLPDYFGKEKIGAHITVIYPEENIKINKNDLYKKHDFVINDIVSALIGQKIYYIFLVESPSLLNLRRSYYLTNMLYFKGYSIGFHITIGVKA